MPLNIRDEEVNALASRLAALRGLNKTQAVKLALSNELRRADKKTPLLDRIRPILDRVASYPAAALGGRAWR